MFNNRKTAQMLIAIGFFLTPAALFLSSTYVFSQYKDFDQIEKIVYEARYMSPEDRTKLYDEVEKLITIEKTAATLELENKLDNVLKNNPYLESTVRGAILNNEKSTLEEESIKKILQSSPTLRFIQISGLGAETVLTYAIKKRKFEMANWLINNYYVSPIASNHAYETPLELAQQEEKKEKDPELTQLINLLKRKTATLESSFYKRVKAKL